ncbi:hypothetical protein NQ318_001427 [Aromia moschata]|uniref:Transposase Tc1-like domain-containing protein n=1 Tax=Aromia moschata TaxID=1265417 RepID=A0AAV8YWR3_9CUCU|nr:hypothetical protein NQ318_001427 [Aromia moschata]
MPRHLSEAQRARAIAKLEENWSLTEVAAELNVSKSCIFYIKKRWQGEQRLQRTIRQGIGKVSTENEDNALVEFINHNPFETVVKAREETLFPGSLRTTQRHLKQCGFKNCVAAHKMFLTEEHKQRRVQFANEFLQGNEFWNNVLFSDEKTFQSSKYERLHVSRSRNTRFEENYTLSTTNSGRFSVDVWAWISVHDPGVCWQIDGRLTSAHYTNILENVMLPTVRVKNIYKRDFRPTIRDQLWESIENAWEEVVDSYDMRTLIASMPRRLENIVASNGCAIKY